MVTLSSIIFRVNQELYGLETRVVKEVLWIPELFQSPSLPNGIAGIFSYRGTVIPVLTLHQEGGGNPRKLRIHDQIVVVEGQDKVMGLVVDQVEEVMSVGVEQISSTSARATEQGMSSLGVVGLAKFENHTVKMLDPSRVLQDLDASPTRELLDSLTAAILAGKSSQESGMCVQASSEGFEPLTQEECDLLQERAVALAKGEPVVDTQKWVTLAVVRLNDHYVGLDPLVVREFAELGHIVPIPCCPKFVLGHMNLHGEIMTVFDLRHVLNIPVAENLPLSQVAVIKFETFLFGIGVHEVLECALLQSSNGANSGRGSDGDTLLKGVCQYQNNPLKYLDIPRLITNKVLEVYEEV